MVEVDMNGLRKNMTEDINKLAILIESLQANISTEAYNEIAEAYSQCARNVNFINSLHLTKYDSFVNILKEAKAKTLD